MYALQFFPSSKACVVHIINDSVHLWIFTSVMSLVVQGFAYVSYNAAETAALAVEHLNGIEFPPGSGHCMKVRCTSKPCMHISQTHCHLHMVPIPAT